jgi:type I restriction enzyme, S subunit
MDMSPNKPADRRIEDVALVDEIALTGFDETAADTYRREHCAVFRKTGERWGGLSNMAPEFPLWVNGIDIRTSEALYQAARFPRLPTIQREILAQASPMAAKMKSKPHRHEARPDFDALRVPILWWALRVKLACNPVTFAGLLTSTAGRFIVEDSHKDTYWGAVPAKTDHSLLHGANVLGRLLVRLRDIVVTFDPALWQPVPPPSIADFLLDGQPVGTVKAPPLYRDNGPVITPAAGADG